MPGIDVTHPEIAAQWHPTKNGTLQPADVTAGSHKKVWWRCPITCPQGCPHEWESTIDKRCTGGRGCPFCSQKQVSCEHVSITHTYPEIAAQWHPTKNSELLPSQFTAGSGKKVWWRCPKTCPQGCPHEWEATIDKRCLAERGCPYCSKSPKKICKHTSIAYTHPDIAAQWHPTKNGGLLPADVMAGSGRKVWWRCPNTCPQGCLHEWEATIDKRCLAERGCPYCSLNNKQKPCNHYSIAYTHPDIAAQWHPTKNGTLSPLDVTAGSHKKVWWRCPNTLPQGCLHEWKATIAKRCLAERGCPYCVNKTEAKLHEYLKSLFPDIQAQYRASWCINSQTNKHLPFDFYIPSLKLLIELDGPQHFRQVSNWECHRTTTKRDVYKMQQAATQGISMLRLVQEEVLDASPEWLEEYVKPHLIYHEPPTQTLLSVNNPDLYADHWQLLADTDTISIEDSIGSEEGDEEVEDPDSEELISSDDTD